MIQIILLGASAFFAFKIYEHVQQLQDKEEDVIEAPLSPKVDIDALVEAADKAYDTGNMQEARQLLQEAYEADDTIAELAKRLGFVLAQMQQYEEALILYNRALELDEEDVTHLAIASVQKNLGNFEAAERHYERAIALDDRYEVSYFNYANLLVDMGKKDEAIKMYEKALEIAPDLEAAQEELEKLRVS